MACFDLFMGCLVKSRQTFGPRVYVHRFDCIVLVSLCGLLLIYYLYTWASTTLVWQNLVSLL